MIREYIAPFLVGSFILSGVFALLYIAAREISAGMSNSSQRFKNYILGVLIFLAGLSATVVIIYCAWAVGRMVMGQ